VVALCRNRLRIGWGCQPLFAVHLADNGTLEIHRRVDLGGWMSWIAFAAEDAKTSRPLSADGTSLYMLDSRGRDTAALNKIDLADESTSLLAADSRFDLCGMIVDGRTQEPIAYAEIAEGRNAAAKIVEREAARHMCAWIQKTLSRRSGW
jgi:hypothetical protein